MRVPLAEVFYGRKSRIPATAEERRGLWARFEENAEATLERPCELWEDRQEDKGVGGDDEPSDPLSVSQK